MRGKTAVRAATLLALTWVVAPLWGQDARDPKVAMDLELGGAVGQMSLLRPAGCGGPTAQNTNFLGTYGKLGLKSRPSSGPWRHRLAGEVSGDFRIHSIGDEQTELGPIGVGRASVGWSSRFLGVRAGGWAGNIGENEELMGFFSAAVRIGLPDRYLRVSLFDQPACYLASCLLGVDGLWTLDGLAIQGGLSLGLAGWRGYLRLPFALGNGTFWLHPGLELGFDEDQQPVYALTLGVGLPSL